MVDADGLKVPKDLLVEEPARLDDTRHSAPWQVQRHVDVCAGSVRVGLDCVEDQLKCGVGNPKTEESIGRAHVFCLSFRHPFVPSSAVSILPVSRPVETGNHEI